MRKFFCTLCLSFIFFICSFNVFAAQGYDFKMEYEGNVIQNVEKTAKVLLVGTSATPYTNVRIKVDITGPSTPTLYAKDSTGQEFDIATIGYWGPPAGFAVGGNFTNTTPIRAKFTQTGKYTLTLSLIDVSNANNLITSNTFNINVLSNNPPVEDNGNVEDITQLPQTGRGISIYLLYALITIAIILIATLFIKKNKQKE